MPKRRQPEVPYDVIRRQEAEELAKRKASLAAQRIAANVETTAPAKKARAPRKKFGLPPRPVPGWR